MAEYETRFVAAGTLPRPRWIGRLVRLAVGLLTLKMFVDLVRFEILMDRDSGLTSWRAPDQLFFWAVVALFFWILPHVVNLGFGRSWGHRPQLVLAAALAVVAAVGLATRGAAWTPALGWAILLWLLYESFHLGTSFVLSAAIGTPGCEMRAIPDLWSRLSGKRSAEHYCPGFLDGIDRWELSRATRGE